MDIAAILREIDAEIEKLRLIRTIVEELLPSAPQTRIKKKRQAPVQRIVVTPEPKPIVQQPTLIVLPPKAKREYRPRYKAVGQEPRALASVIPKGPVFVPRAEATVLPEAVSQKIDFGSEALEAAVRKNFLGVAS
jgi:hypothetical protein